MYVLSLPPDFLWATYSGLAALIFLPSIFFVRSIPGSDIESASGWPRIAAEFLGYAVVAMMVWSTVAYLTDPGYLDHIEPTIAGVSWWYSHGHKLYPAWNDGEGLYGLIYGPLVYQATAFALSFRPSILMSKLPGVACCWLGAVTVAVALRPLISSVRQTVLPMSVCLIVAGTFENTAYWNRPDPYLFLCAALALFAVLRFRPATAAVAIGILGGLSINLKLHGGFYIFPCAMALFVPWVSFANAARIAAIVALSGLPTLVVPFLDPNVSFTQYVAYLRSASRHGMDLTSLLTNLGFASVLLMPVLILAWANRERDTKTAWPVALAYVTSILTVAIIAAKAGSGMPHLLPFLPAFAFTLVTAAKALHGPGCRRDAIASNQTRFAIPFLLMLLAYMPAFTTNLRALRGPDFERISAAESREVAELYAEYPDAVAGVAGDDTYKMTFFRVIGVLAGGRPDFDVPAWQDLLQSGAPASLPEQLVIDCQTSTWIIPRGERPFTRLSYYPGHPPLFTDRFRELFRQNYKLVKETANYTVYACQARQAGLTVRGSSATVTASPTSH
jgi:membrane protein YdbS with pleckstrin-like domain